jgi:hypothetical protein
MVWGSVFDAVRWPVGALQNGFTGLDLVVSGRNEISYFLGVIHKPVARDDADGCALVIPLRLLSAHHRPRHIPARLVRMLYLLTTRIFAWLVLLALLLRAPKPRFRVVSCGTSDNQWAGGVREDAPQ